MSESIQKPSIVKRLFSVGMSNANGSRLRCVVALLVTCLWLTSSSCVVWHSYFNDGIDAYDQGDYETALRHWHRAAAEQDHANAQNNLGSMYKEGEGVPRDYVEAYMWFTLAAERGSKRASNNRDRIAKQMTSGQIAEAQRRARDWKPGNIPPEYASVKKPQREEPDTSSGSGIPLLATARGTLTLKDSKFTWVKPEGQSPNLPSQSTKQQSSKRRSVTTSQRHEPSTPTSALPPVLSIEEITFSVSVLDADETATLSLRIKNVGPGDARNLSIKLSSTLQGLAFPASINVPTISKQGGEKTVNIPIRGTLELPTATAALDIRLSESQFKLEIPGKRLRFETRQFQNPELVLANAAVLEGPAAVPNNQINLNEMIDLKFYVQNTGIGAAENVRVTVENSQRGVLWAGVVSEKGLQREHPTFATIAAGKYELVTYSYLVNSEFTDTQLQFNIRATEQHGRWGFTETQTAAINTTLTPLGTITEQPRENNIPRRKPQVEELPALEIDVRKDIPETSVKNPNAVAVVIGNQNYTNPGVPDVAYAQNDALIVKQYLIDTLGYSEENIHYHINATKGVFEEVFGNEATHRGRLFDYVTPDGSSDVFIYYSGHGAPDIESKQPYLVPTDANPSTVAVGGYPLKLLYLNLKQVPYRSATVVIDSCFSGISASGALIPGAKGYGIPLVEIPLLPPEKSVIFTATNKRQVANGYNDKQHSLFTYFFLKALRGDADTDADDRLTVAEIFAYISQHVPRTSRREYGSSREQTPQVDGNRSLVIVQY